MKTLKVTNESGSKYTFYVEGYTIYIEALTKSGKLMNLSVENNAHVEGGKLMTSKGLIPVNTDTDLIQNFIDSAETRELVSFNSHDEMMVSLRSLDDDSNTGAAFERDNKHHYYVYNK